MQKTSRDARITNKRTVFFFNSCHRITLKLIETHHKTNYKRDSCHKIRYKIALYYKNISQGCMRYIRNFFHKNLILHYLNKQIFDNAFIKINLIPRPFKAQLLSLQMEYCHASTFSKEYYESVTNRIC